MTDLGVRNFAHILRVSFNCRRLRIWTVESAGQFIEDCKKCRLKT
jgi:hypothetical protein